MYVRGVSAQRVGHLPGLGGGHLPGLGVECLPHRPYRMEFSPGFFYPFPLRRGVMAVRLDLSTKYSLACGLPRGGVSARGDRVSALGGG